MSSVKQLDSRSVIVVEINSRPSVLWCYKKDLGFTSHRKKREQKIKRDVKRGIREPNEASPFELFVSVTDIRYTYYKDTPKVLGQTFGMLVLQDFESITPNLLARTIETVEGGGTVVLLLKTMSSLKQLYSMSMDVHQRYRTESQQNPVSRFNERFILSLGANPSCLVLDDELNVLPISKGKDIKPVQAPPKKNAELDIIKEELKSTDIVGSLVKSTKTVDQAKSLLTFVEAIAEKTLSSTVTLTAGRGRGKSAALGLAMAAALAHGYSNVFVTSPTPENLRTLFEFLFKGLDGLGYEEHLDYDIVQSANPDFQKAIVRVNIFKHHRQTIQYIQPQDAHVLGQAELVVIDEAAAIPLPLVRNLIGPYLVFMSSTINGYEGTGRSLSLKLIQQLREQTRPTISKETNDGPTKKKGQPEGATTAGKARTLRELRLEEPIRYSPGDEVEKWLNGLLCLDATVTSKAALKGTPHPSTCQLFYVNRDTLFSYHPASEAFLQRMMGLYVASHYKNSPNDLQLMSDAPGHALFVLLPPLRGDETSLPEPLVVLQVAFEGQISKESILNALSKGQRAGGDLIPWLVSQQFQDENFAQLSGVRIVRVASHPDYSNMGYGSRALEQLNSFFSGELYEGSGEDNADEVFDRSEDSGDLMSDNIKVRDASSMPPLLQRLSERKPEKLDYLGVSYGMTENLLRFWKRRGYVPLYIRQTANELTGEHSCMMIRGLNSSTEETAGWLSAFAQDFRRRFLSLLSYKFREFPSLTALTVLEAAAIGTNDEEGGEELSANELRYFMSPFDMKRLESYASNMLDYHVIVDLLPHIAMFYFTKRFGDEKLSAVQSSILLSLGLQRKQIEDVEAELDVPVSQALALFMKSIRRMTKRLQDVEKQSIGESIPTASTQIVRKTDGGTADWSRVDQDIEEELDEAGREALKTAKRDAIDSLDMKKYALPQNDDDWKDAEVAVDQGKTSVSVKKRKGDDSPEKAAKKSKKRTSKATLMPSSTHTKKRLTYVLKENNNKTLLGIPDASARINRTFPLYSRLEEAMETSMTTLDKDDHPRHSLGVTTLALDTATQLSGKPGPEGILYTSGKDGLVASWQLGIQTRQRNRRYGTDSPVEHFSEKFEIEREPQSAPIFRQCVQTHTDHCNDILLAMQNQVLISASSDRTVKAWRPHGDAQVPTVVGTHADFVKVLSHARDRHWIASGGLDRFARIWDLNQGGEVVRLPAQHSVYALTTNHSAGLLLTGTPSRTVNVWDPRSAKLVHNLDGHTDNIRSLLLSEDSTKALSASSDSTIKLWDLRNMSTIKTFEHHYDSVWSLFSQSPSLETFYSGDRQGRICKVVGEDVKDVATARHGITKLVASDDKLVVSASASSSSVSIWNDVDQKEQDDEEVDHDATPKLKTRAPSISSRISTRNDPLAVIRGRHGIIRALMLNNRRHVLTLNTQRHVSLWDIVTCVCVGQYTDEAVDAILGADEGADALTLTSQEVLERVRDKIEGQAVTNAWNSIDCQTGSLAVHLDESRCFDGEAYLDELGLAIENRETDQRVNLAKLVLTNLLRHFIDYEKKHIGDERPKPSPETNDKAYINQNAGTPTVGTPSGTPQIGVSRQLATPPATPALPPPALADPPPSERTTSSHSRGDYIAFEKKNEQQSGEKSAFLEASQNRPALVLRSPDNESVGETSSKKNETPDGSSSPALASPLLSSSPSNSRLGGLMGRMLISNSRRDKKESIKREESKESSPVITPIQMPESTNTMDSVKSRFKPATDDVTSIILNDNIPIGVSEETHDSEAFVSIYRGLVGTTGEPGDVKHLEKSLPEWVLEMVLCNNVYKDPRTPKATFWLERHPDEKDLGGLPERLTASRFLRARKLMNYVRDKLPADKTVSNEIPVEEQLELYCNNVKLDVTLTLGAIKSYIWQARRNDEPDDDSLIDPVIYYKKT
ncbi:N-acetyltransferase 10 [Wallemia mellicola]|nr:N-acetyltransferase 10 [Wallemia mellicola]